MPPQKKTDSNPAADGADQTNTPPAEEGSSAAASGATTDAAAGASGATAGAEPPATDEPPATAEEKFGKAVKIAERKAGKYLHTVWQDAKRVWKEVKEIV